MNGDSGLIFRPGKNDGYTEERTTRGKVYVHKEHGKTELKKNKATAKYFANKYGQKIWLLPNPDNTKSPDVFNETLGVFQEYKEPVSTKASAIVNAIRAAKKQANNLVITINPRTSLESVRWALNDQIKRARNVQSVTLIRMGKDVTYTQSQIIRRGFKIKRDDFK